MAVSRVTNAAVVVCERQVALDLDDVVFKVGGILQLFIRGAVQGIVDPISPVVEVVGVRVDVVVNAQVTLAMEGCHSRGVGKSNVWC